jgi:hypothetical protein
MMLVLVTLSSCSSYLYQTVPESRVQDGYLKQTTTYLGTESLKVSEKHLTWTEMLNIARKKYGQDVTIQNVRQDRRFKTFVVLPMGSKVVNLTFDVVRIK